LLGQTYLAPSMLCCRLKVSLQLVLSSKTKQACKAHKLVTNRVVVLKVVLQTPLVVESAEAKVAVYFMAEGVVDVVFKTIAVFEHTPA
jgi:hypothetical protein